MICIYRLFSGRLFYGYKFLTLTRTDIFTMTSASSNDTLPGQPILSLDTLFAFPFFGIYILLYKDPKGVMLSALLIIYLVVDIVWPWIRISSQPILQRRVLLVKLVLILLAVGLVVFVPAGLIVAERLRTGSPTTFNDSLAQVEAGLDFLKQGLNPYSQDFSHTLVAQVPYFDANGPLPNPAFQHFAYLPLFLEFSFPFYLVFRGLFGWWDERLLYMLMLLVSLGALLQLSREPARKLSLVILAGLNPMIMLLFIAGTNEIFPLMWLTLAAAFLIRRRTGWGWAMLALGVASKQTVWFVVPYALVYGLGQPPWNRKRFSQALRPLIPAGLVLMITFLPFLLWDARSFVEDAFGYLLGAGSAPAAIDGVGLGGLLLQLGVIHGGFDSYPFVLWQLAIGGPLALFLLWLQIRRNDLRLIWVYGACLGIVMTFLSRIFLDRYLGFYLVVAAMGALADPQEIALSRQPDVTKAEVGTGLEARI
jgi:hypothetical protein